MIKKMNCKGEVTTAQIVTIIVLIASFVIILLLLFRLNLGATTDKEICHNSVVLASKGKGLVGRLDCKTSYVCISGGGKCKDISATITREVNPDNPDEIMKAIADEMADCWWMFGEGELGYLGTDIKNYHCAICNIVKFDEKIISTFPEITYLEFYEYLSETKKTNVQTYLGYLYGVSDIDSVKKMNKQIDFDNEKILTNARFAIITGINPNWPFADSIINPYFIKADEVLDKTSCKVFDITKS